MVRLGLVLLTLAACWRDDPPAPPGDTPAPVEVPARRRMIGTWVPDPDDAARLDAWRAAATGAPAPPGDAVAAWLAAHRAHPDAVAVAAAVDLASSIRLRVTEDTLELTRPEGTWTAGWVLLDETVTEAGDRVLALELTDPTGTRTLDLHLLDDDHLEVAPRSPTVEPSRFRRVER